MEISRGKMGDRRAAAVLMGVSVVLMDEKVAAASMVAVRALILFEFDEMRGREWSKRRLCADQECGADQAGKVGTEQRNEGQMQTVLAVERAVSDYSAIMDSRPNVKIAQARRMSQRFVRSRAVLLATHSSRQMFATPMAGGQ